MVPSMQDIRGTPINMPRLGRRFALEVFDERGGVGDGFVGGRRPSGFAAVVDLVDGDEVVVVPGVGEEGFMGEAEEGVRLVGEFDGEDCH